MTLFNADSPAPSSAISKFLDIVLPYICPSCRLPVEAGQSLCGPCWSKLQFITKPMCSCCGLPFAFDLGEDALCAPCLESPPKFTMARSALKYDDHCKSMILAFKHADKTHLRLLLSKWALQAGREFWPESDILAPVPLHWTRLFKRLYNQSALLGEELSKATSIPHQADLLLRQKKTRVHQGLSKDERRSNVRRAFQVAPKYRDYIRGKTVVLLDDVMTSGATVNECAETLHKAGAAKIHILTLARVCFD